MKRIAKIDGLGMIVPRQLGEGTPSTVTYLRGDRTWATLSATGGGVTSASNVGTGTAIFKQLTGTDLEFKTVQAGANVTLTPAGDVLIIGASSGAGTPSGSVVSEQTHGLGSSAGVSAEYSRGDHTHGSPTDPVPAHVAAADPHPVYLTAAEGDAAYATTGAVSNHEAKADPHPGYLTTAEGDAAYATVGAVSTHEGKADPHPGYLTSAEGNAAYATITHFHDALYATLTHGQGRHDGSVASLSNGKVPTYQMGSGTADATTFLRGDNTWAAPGGGSNPFTMQVSTIQNGTDSNTVFSTVNYVKFTAAANTRYVIEGFLKFRTAALTTGIALAWNAPSGTTLVGQSVINNAAAAGNVSAQIGVASTTGPSTAVWSTNLDTPAYIWVIASTTGTAGTIYPLFRSEVSASFATLQAYCLWRSMVIT